MRPEFSTDDANTSRAPSNLEISDKSKLTAVSSLPGVKEEPVVKATLYEPGKENGVAITPTGNGNVTPVGNNGNIQPTKEHGEEDKSGFLDVFEDDNSGVKS